MPIPFQRIIPLNDLKLRDDRVDIWEFPLNMDVTWGYAILSPDEIKRANRYHFERHRRRFIVARATLRTLLGYYTGIPPQHVVFKINPYGKPSIDENHSLHFNLSHSKELALLGITQSHPLGIDLEFFSGRSYEGIAKHAFSPKEIIALSQLPSPLKILSFFHIWAQKEAFIKATGMGLAYPTSSFTVPILPTTHIEIEDTLHKSSWQLQSFMPYPLCAAALCYKPNIVSIRYQRVHEGILHNG